MKRKVRVTGPGVKLNNIWCYINEEAVIDEKQYKENEKYVEVIEEIEETKTEDIKPAAPVVQKEPVEEKEKIRRKCLFVGSSGLCAAFSYRSDTFESIGQF